MFAVGLTVAVPIIVGTVVHLLGKERFVVPLLQLYGVRATFLGLGKQLFALLYLALVIVADFSDDVTISIIGIRVTIDR